MTALHPDITKRRKRVVTLDQLLERAMPIPFAGCFVWMCSLTKGYGNVRIWGRTRRAHQVAFLLSGRKIPPGMEIDHKCRVTSCVNPDHLEAVTHIENIRRGDCGKHWAVKTHCPSGHPYSAENTFINKRGARVCRICRRDACRRCAAKRRARNAIS